MLLTACTPRPWTACITGGRENMLITDEQLAEYVGAIIANQSADVDIVSGATVDCQAIGTAIGQAFAK